MTLKDNSPKQILIAAIITILLQTSIVAAIAVHQVCINRVEKTVDTINSNYIPMFFLEGMLENMNYQTQEIVATMNGDAAKVHEINDKYIKFQKSMLNNLNQMRGGISNVSRDGNVSEKISK